MNIGKAWIVVEQPDFDQQRTFVSIISPRRPPKFVMQYIEQMYIDRHTTFEEKASFKKNPKSCSYRANPLETKYQGCMDIGYGNGPIISAYYCHKIELNNKDLIYTYKYLQSVVDRFTPIFADITDSAIIN